MRQRIETLRDWAENRTMAPGDRSDLKWAIQELAHLEARVQELEGEKSKIVSAVEEVSEEVIAELEAENTRLREQVRWVIGRINHKPEFSEVAEQLKRTLEEKP